MQVRFNLAGATYWWCHCKVFTTISYSCDPHTFYCDAEHSTPAMGGRQARTLCQGLAPYMTQSTDKESTWEIMCSFKWTLKTKRNKLPVAAAPVTISTPRMCCATIGTSSTHFLARHGCKEQKLGPLIFFFLYNVGTWTPYAKEEAVAKENGLLA